MRGANIMNVRRLLPAVLIAAAFSGTATAGPACPEANLVEDWYRQYLHRPADRLGLDVWTGQLRAGAPPDLVLAKILGSEEYFHNNGCNPRGYIASLYADLASRAPAPAELNGWLSRLHACGCRVTLARELLASLSPGGGPACDAPPPPPVLRSHYRARPAPPPVHFSLRFGGRRY
jgi:hypothetical protein